MNETRRCTKCLRTKLADDFHWKNKERGWRKSWCKTCEKARKADYAASNPELVREQRQTAYQKHLKKK